MTFYEKDLEQIIYESDKDALLERGLSVQGKLKRQLRIGNYGIADLVEIVRPIYVSPTGIIQKGTITIYELKKDNISVSTFMQAVGYAKGISRYLELRDKSHFFNIEIVLIGKNIDVSGEFVFLTDLFEYKECCLYSGSEMNLFVNFYTYDYNIDGMSFNKIEGYRKINEGFML